MAGMNSTTDDWGSREDADLGLRVRQAQIQQLYKQTWTGLTGVLVITIAVFVVLWPVVSPLRLSLWGGVNVLLSLARGVLGVAFIRKAPSGPSVSLWAKLHVAGAVASGLVWAVPSFILWPAGHIRQHTEVEFSHGMCPDCEDRLYQEHAHLRERR